MAENKHPPELKILFFTEMWERFSFYLMIGILPLYLSDSQKGGMGWSDEKAAVVVGSYGALVYFTPFIGGLLADRLLGCRRTIMAGALLMMVGHLVLAWPTELGLFLGLGFLIVGNGSFKPNMSTLVGNLYPPGSPLKDAGYNIYYMGVNLGAFICNFVAAIVRNTFDQYPLRLTSTWSVGGWHAAFATAAVGMLLGLVLFGLNYRHFAQFDPEPGQGQAPAESLTPFWVQCLIPALVCGTLGWFLSDNLQFGLNGPTMAFLGACIPVIVFYLSTWRKIPDPGDRGRVAALLVIFGVVVIFWMTFYLNYSALSFWTRDDTGRVPGTLLRPLTDHFEAFAENAPPDYFVNADPQTPRPAPSTFEVVSPEQYKKLEDAKALRVVEGEPVVVTQKMFDEVYKDTDSTTPVLPPGKHLKVVNTELFQSINAGFVILFTPLVVGFWHWLRNLGREPSTSSKIGLGLLLTAGSPALMLAATMVSSDGAMKASAWWLFGTYAVITVGELCLSPMGLSLVNKMSPAGLRAFLMGGWFLATAFGSKLSGIFGEAYTKMDHRAFWIILVVCDVVFGLIIFALLPWLNRQMADHKVT